MAFRLFKHEWAGTDYTNHDELDVKDCIKKLIDPLVAGGCGWSWDTTHCPNSEPITLQPSTRVYAAFITHYTGAKAMIGYSLNGIRYGNTPTVDGTNYDVGFMSSKMYTSTDNETKMVSLFFAYITADSVNNNGSDFHPEYSTFDENFYDSQMSPVFSLSTSISSGSGTYYNQCKPMINNVTDNNICKHYLMADTEIPILYLGSQYNNNGIKQAMFGEFADGQKRYDYDIRDTSKFRCLLGCGYESTSSSTYGEKTIVPYTTTSTVTYVKYYSEIIKFSTDGGLSTGDSPKYFNNSWTTSATASYIYDSYRVWNPNIRAIYQEGMMQGQIYGNGQWCCLGDVTNNKTSYIRSFKVCWDGSTSNLNRTIIVKWDSEFNQGNRLV